MPISGALIEKVLPFDTSVQEIVNVPYGEIIYSSHTSIDSTIYKSLT